MYINMYAYIHVLLHIKCLYSMPCTSSTDGDYDGTSQVVVIPASPGPSETCFDIGIVDDSIVENNEDFRVSFEIPPGSNAEVGPISSTRVIIVDDDRKKFKTLYLLC